MPIYTYRREDGSTFDIRQKFTDDALAVDPETGQSVVRIVQPANIVFKGSGFYVTDNKSARSSTAISSETANGNGSSNGSSNGNNNGTSNGKANGTAESASPRAEASTSSSNSASSASAGES